MRKHGSPCMKRMFDLIYSPLGPKARISASFSHYQIIKPNTHTC
jgi:hypothetical protein